MSNNYSILDVIKDEILGKAEYVDQQIYIDRVSTCFSCPNSIEIFPKVRNCKICRMFY